MTRRHEISKVKILNKERTATKSANWYTVSSSLALILYAERDNKFKKYLKDLIVTNLDIGSGIESDQEKITKETTLLIPENSDNAMSRAHWLVGNIASKSLPGSKEAEAELQSWVEDNSLVIPRQLIIGIFGVAIIGPTLGLIDKKKVVISIVREDLIRKNKLQLTKKVTQTSHGMMISALEMAGKDINKLEPDVADWFFGEKELLFYDADTNKIRQIEKDLRQLGVAYAASKDSQGLAVLVMSPSVNSHYSEIYWDLKAVDM